MTERHGRMKSWTERFAPWGVSILFHGALALVLAFVVFQAVPPRPSGATVALSPSAYPRRVTPKPMRATMLERETTNGNSFQEVTGVAPRRPRGAEAQPASEEETTFSLEKGSATPLETWTEAPAGEETASFFGADAPAKDIVYLIDFSASLGESFDAIRREMLRSIGRLNERQRFHIILFADGKPLEAKAGRLAPATRAAKRAAAEFLAGVEPAGRTDPVAAIARAFAVLRSEQGNTKLICLLTDGAFQDSAEAIRAIETRNRSKAVRVNTYLCGGGAVSAATLRRIAERNGGTFVDVDGR